MRFVDWVSVAAPFQQIDGEYACSRKTSYAMKAIGMFNAALL
jgi:hypothetical protein